MTRDLVLQARVAMVRSSLTTVQRVLGDLEAARHAFGLGGTTSVGAARIEAAVTEAVQDLRKGQEAPDCKSKAAVARQLEEVLDDVERQRKLHSLLTPRRLTMNRTLLDVDLREEFLEGLTELSEIEQKIAGSRGADDAATEARLSQAWVEYSEWHATRLRVFTDYVELVRGVLLRDAGLDNDLCRIADELVRLSGKFRDYDWQAFTIPASDEERGVSSLRLIRIGFPEWSIWGIPLTMYDFGQVFADIHPQMRELVDDARRDAVEATRQAAGGTATTEYEPAAMAKRASRAGDDAAKVVRTWIADAYATAVMGPAYVWAAMLLRADPSSESDDRRLAVMLEMMRAIDESSTDESTTTDFAKERGRIREEWTAARAQVASGPGIAPVSAEMSELVKSVRKRVTVPFGAADWARAIALTDDLENDDDDARQQVAGRLQIGHLRRVLAAAWNARIRLADKRFDPSADLPPERLPAERSGFAESQRARSRELAERARVMCVSIIDADIPELRRRNDVPTAMTVQSVEAGRADKVHDLPPPAATPSR